MYEHCGWTELEWQKYIDAPIAELIKWEDTLRDTMRSLKDSHVGNLPGSDHVIDELGRALETLQFFIARRLSDAV